MGFEDDPRAEEWDKYGRVYRKETQVIRSTSSMSYVKDFQQNLAKEMVSKWNLDSEGARKIKAREMVQKFNTYTNTKDGGLNLTQEQKRIIIKSALKKEREV